MPDVSQSNRVDRFTMCISYTLTPVINILYTVIIEVYLHCFMQSVSLRDLGKSTSRAEISRPNSLNFKAVKRAQV